MLCLISSLIQKNIIEFSSFEALDLVSEEISRRFDQASLALPKTIEELLITACNHPVEGDVAIPDI